MTDRLSRQYRPPLEEDPYPYPSRGPLSSTELDALIGYHERVGKGVVHTPEYVERMRVFQDRWVRHNIPKKRRRFW